MTAAHIAQAQAKAAHPCNELGGRAAIVTPAYTERVEHGFIRVRHEVPGRAWVICQNRAGTTIGVIAVILDPPKRKAT